MHENKTAERPTKGHFGYLKRRKRGLLIHGLILLAGVLSLYFIGLVTLKTRNNLLTVVAVVSTLPMAMQFATLFAMLSYKSRPGEEYEEVRNIIGNGVLDTELYVSNKDGKSLELDYAYFHESGIYVYTSDLKMDMVKTPEYIRNYLRLNQCDTNVQMYTDLAVYKKRLKELPPSDRSTVSDKVLEQEGVLRAISM